MAMWLDKLDCVFCQRRVGNHLYTLVLNFENKAFDIITEIIKSNIYPMSFFLYMKWLAVYSNNILFLDTIFNLQKMQRKCSSDIYWTNVRKINYCLLNISERLITYFLNVPVNFHDVNSYCFVIRFLIQFSFYLSAVIHPSVEIKNLNDAEPRVFSFCWSCWTFNAVGEFLTLKTHRPLIVPWGHAHICQTDLLWSPPPLSFHLQLNPSL